MGSGNTYLEYGNEYDNTVVGSDVISLGILKAKPRKITHLRVYVKDYIVGFE